MPLRLCGCHDIYIGVFAIIICRFAASHCRHCRYSLLRYAIDGADMMFSFCCRSLLSPYADLFSSRFDVYATFSLFCRFATLFLRAATLAPFLCRYLVIAFTPLLLHLSDTPPTFTFVIIGILHGMPPLSMLIERHTARHADDAISLRFAIDMLPMPGYAAII